MKFNIKSLLKDKNVLYVVLFLAVTNLFGYLMAGNFDAIMLFLVAGFASTYFSKNMIIIMLIAMLTTNFLIGGKFLGYKIKEGLEGMKEGDEGKEGKESKESKNDMKKNKEGKKMTDNNNNKNKNSTATIQKKKNSESVEVVDDKKKDGMKTLSPANINDDGDDDDYDGEVIGAKPKVNFASTLESAYDNLDKLLSSDAIGKMSSDTQRLAEKQQVLMGNIDKLAPMMDNAQNLLKGLNVDKMGDMLNNMQTKLGNLTNN